MQLSGRIKRLDSRGFGFISQDDGPDYFFHMTGLVANAVFELLQEGQRVRFEPDTADPGGKGPRAARVAVEAP